MKKLLFLILALSTMSAFAGGYAKWNSLFNRWDYYGDNGSSTGYSNYNNLFNQYEFHGANGDRRGTAKWNSLFQRWDYGD